MGLLFLSKHQQPDGSWRLQGMEETAAQDPQMVSDSAATAMALLAFQGAGYNHREHKYAAVVRNALDFMVRNQKENGDLFVPLDDNSNKSIWLYSHALATLALCEAYGMTQDPALKEPLLTWCWHRYFCHRSYAGCTAQCRIVGVEYSEDFLFTNNSLA
jgi:hypothetical protein